MRIPPWRSLLLSTGLTAASRLLLLRDSLLGVTKRLRKPVAAECFFFASGDRTLSAVFVHGTAGLPVVLLCHGIGETVEHWSAVQARLQDDGIASLVFNYSGYARSSSKIRVDHCNQDLIHAYAELRRRVGLEASIFLLGFSLGSGVAAHGASTLEPPIAGLFLCEAFTSFREAAAASGLPYWLAHAVPDVWNTVAVIREIRVPLYLVHSDADRLFPLDMPKRIIEAHGQGGELIVVPGLLTQRGFPPTNQCLLATDH